MSEAINTSQDVSGNYQLAVQMERANIVAVDLIKSGVTVRGVRTVWRDQYPLLVVEYDSSAAALLDRMKLVYRRSPMPGYWLERYELMGAVIQWVRPGPEKLNILH
jgi:hypothetical protein